MIELVDIHCHALSLTDDGATDDNMMYRMLDAAYNDGIRKICLTPHYNVDLFGDNTGSSQAAFKKALEYCAKKLPDLQLFMGNEVNYQYNSLDSFLSGKCLTINNSRYALLDFTLSGELKYILKAVEEVQNGGYIPIIAHIERYPCFRGKHKEIAKLIRQGVIIQCNATSIMDRRASLGTKRMLKTLFRNYLVDVVASDGHDDSERPPLMRACAEYISKKYGEEYAQTLFSENPKKILNNESI